MQVKILYDSLFFDLTQRHQETVTLAQATLAGLVGVLSQVYGRAFQEMVGDPATGTASPQVTILVNGQHQSWDAALEEGDELAFLVPIAGGMP